jgi:hypothetical protein
MGFIIKGISLFLVAIVFALIIGGGVMSHNMEVEDCQLLEENGFETKSTYIHSCQVQLTNGNWEAASDELIDQYKEYKRSD